MLVFVIPLKSAKISKSWDLVCKLFERTIKSVCNQTSPDFRVIVVCNEKPPIEFNHPYITYIEVDFLIPEPGKVAGLMDRARKVLTGLYYALELKPSHAMIVDADDCVSKHLVDFVNKNPQCNGWFVDRGYVYNEGSKFIYLRKKAFHSWCGTSHIIRYDLYKLSVDWEKDKEYLYTYFGNHKAIKYDMSKNGMPLEALPFPGVVYVVGNRENMSQKNFSQVHNVGENLIFKIKDARNYRLLTKSVAEEFCLYRLNYPLNP